MELIRILYFCKVESGLISDYSSEQLGVDHLLITSQLGNLLARIMSKKLIKNMGGNITDNAQPAFDEQLAQVRDEVGRRMEDFHVTKACEEIMDVLQQVRVVPRSCHPPCSPRRSSVISRMIPGLGVLPANILFPTCSTRYTD